MRIGWIATIALLLLIAVKVGLTPMRTDGVASNDGGLLFQARESAAKGGARPMWKPILL